MHRASRLVLLSLTICCIALLPTAEAHTPAEAEQASGDLQVTCWPGYRVYVDSELVGLTREAEDGLYLEGLPAGEHQVRIEKLGRVPMVQDVVIRAGGVVELKVPALPHEDVPPSSAATNATVRPEPVPPAPRPVLREAPAPQPEPAAEPDHLTLARQPEAAARHAPRQDMAGAEKPPAEPERLGLRELVRPRVVQTPDVMFVYRVQGKALDGKATVAINRELGGPRSPVLAFLCTEPPGCLDQTSATYPPGRYRFRVTCRRPGPGRRAPAAFKHDLYLEQEAISGSSYLVDVRFDADAAEACSAEIRAIEADSEG